MCSFPVMSLMSMWLIYRAFSVVETLESAWASANQKAPVQLSPQQILSCEYKVDIDLDGCAGGILYAAFDVINVSARIKFPVLSAFSYK